MAVETKESDENPTPQQDAADTAVGDSGSNQDHVPEVSSESQDSSDTSSADGESNDGSNPSEEDAGSSETEQSKEGEESTTDEKKLIPWLRSYEDQCYHSLVLYHAEESRIEKILFKKDNKGQWNIPTVPVDREMGSAGLLPVLRTLGIPKEHYREFKAVVRVCAFRNPSGAQNLVYFINLADHDLLCYLGNLPDSMKFVDTEDAKEMANIRTSARTALYTMMDHRYVNSIPWAQAMDHFFGDLV